MRIRPTAGAAGGGADEAIWSDERWLVTPLAAELGPLIDRIERAVDAVGELGRVHAGRWGDGSAHLHFWFIARPARMPQLRTRFAAVWDDILPPLPEELWRASLAVVARTLATGGGRAHV